MSTKQELESETSDPKRTGYLKQIIWLLYNVAVLAVVVWTCYEVVIMRQEVRKLRIDHQTSLEVVEERCSRCGNFKTTTDEHQRSKVEVKPSAPVFSVIKVDSVYSPEQTTEAKREVLSSDKLDLSSLLHGRDGQPGAPGPQGIQGPPGIPGTDGAPGRDAVNLLSINHLINTTISKVAAAEMEKLRIKAHEIPTVSGSVYTRWGKTTCPQSSSLIMGGRIGGAYYSYSGGSGQYVCLPDDPEYNPLTNFTKIGNYIYSTEFEASDRPIHNHDSTCAVCLADTRTVQVMLPAKLRCPDSSWTLEYSGYLMSENYNHASASGYICVDEQPEPLPGMHGDNDGALLYHVGTDCSGGRGAFGYCPPYVDDKPLSCVVCSK